jgi:hypothetical protein
MASDREALSPIFSTEDFHVMLSKWSRLCASASTDGVDLWRCVGGGGTTGRDTSLSTWKDICLLCAQALVVGGRATNLGTRSIDAGFLYTTSVCETDRSGQSNSQRKLGQQMPPWRMPELRPRQLQEQGQRRTSC